MATPPTGDFLGRARVIAAALIVAAGFGGMIGALLDWVVIEPAEMVADAPDVRNVSQPFTGLDAGDGWWVLAGGAVMIVAAALLVRTGKRAYAWLCFVAAMVMGGIAIAALRGVEDIGSDLSRRMDIVGDADPAFGLWLVAGAALAGLMASALALAATPREAAPTGSEA